MEADEVSIFVQMKSGEDAGSMLPGWHVYHFVEGSKLAFSWAEGCDCCLGFPLLTGL